MELRTKRDILDNQRSFDRSSRKNRAFLRISGLFVAMLAISAGTAIPEAMGQCLDPPGDVTLDGQTSVIDVQCTILAALAQLNNGAVPACLPGPLSLADINCDDSVTVVDVQIDIALTLGQTLDPLLDANANLCVDACEGPCGAGSDGADCDDGDPCTESDSCQAGTCSGLPVNCDDGNECTMDACGATGCTHTPAPSSLSNCLVNHGGLGCDNAGCQNCVCGLDGFCCQVAWDGICASEAANECAGSCPPGGVTICDDGNSCTSGDQCVDGACVGGPINCDDGIGCTDDFCEPGVGCVHLPGATVNFANKDYLFCNASVDYATAKSLCAGFGGEVTTVNNAAENSFLSTEAQAMGLGNPWIGLTDAASEGTFVWDSGQAVSYLGWCPGEPNNFAEEDCTHLNWVCGDGSLAWNDIACTAGYGFICELGCDDGDLCTTDSVGPDGQCIFTSNVSACDDANECTTDTCDPATGACSSAPFGGDKVCGTTGGPGCAYAPCQACVCGIDPFCCNTSWDSICVAETFDPCGDACTIAVACDDGNACTAGDLCMAGECVGAALNCDDGVDCSVDSCDPASGCTHSPVETEVYGDNEYLFCGTALAQPSAEALCISMGGHLVTINSAPENTFVSGHASGIGFGATWIGYTDVAAENQFVWANGQSTTFTGWCPGEPNNAGAGGEHCVHINWGCGDGTLAWNDFPCDAAQPFVCEFGCDDDNDCTLDSGTTQCINNTVAETAPVCNVTGGPGCANTTCQNCVCGLDPFCCNTAWDGICVDEALGICAASCTVAVVVSCDDGDPCTLNDTCTNGACVGTPVVCDDNNPCTVDSCNPTTGSCETTAVVGEHACGTTGPAGCAYAPCQDCVCAIDGFCCTTAWDGICVSETFNPCGAQCTMVAVCDDGNACTTGDACIAETCTGAVTVCDDGNPCTTDACDPASGQCVYNNAPATGFACQTQGPAGCGNAACQACVCGIDPFCCNTAWDGICVSEASNECALACTVGVACDDGDPCTENDVCQGNVCAGTPKLCTDNDVCTTDSCAADGTCVFTTNISTSGASSYVFCPGAVTQAQATVECQARGAKLATLESASENAFVSTEALAYGLVAPWVSLVDTVTENTFVWGTGAPLTYSGWCPGEPNNANNEDCVQLNWGCGGGGFAWNDNNCGAAFSFVCELDCNDTNSCTIDTAVQGELACNNGPLPGANCCESHEQTGCGDFDCQACVCGMDPFCCNTSWDGICAGEAQNQCNAQCNCGSPELYCNDGDGMTVDTCNVVGSCNGNLVNGSCYKPTSVAAGISWSNAENACATWGGHLVTIDNVAENTAVRSLVTTYCGANTTAWIGLNDLISEGQYVWIGGGAPGYTNWASGEPNNVGNEDVVHMLVSGQWNDLPATSNQLCYVCEKAPGAGFCVNTK